MLDTPLVTPKITDRPVREPASEWASSTLDALGPVSHVGDQIASNPTTPGLHVPGAFPDTHPNSNIIQPDIQYAKDAAIGALQTAKGYVPMTVEDVKRLIEDAGDTVVGYLPQSVAVFLPHHTAADTSLSSEPNSQNVASSAGGTLSDPTAHTTANTSEGASQNVHPDGAGTFLANTASHTSLLSKESVHPDSLNERPLEHSAANTVLPSEELSQNILAEERGQQYIPSHDDDPPLSIEDESRTDGVCALPQDKEEALLPDERQSSVGSVSGASTDASTGLPSAKVQDQDLSESLPASSIASSTDASHPITPNTTARTYALAGDGAKFKGVPLSKGFLKELDEEETSPTEKSTDERRNLEQGQSDMATTGHGTTAAIAAACPGTPAGHETVRKKPGFMDKLKGEVKVISGKLSHKESKVEEGKRMMGKA